MLWTWWHLSLIVRNKVSRMAENISRLFEGLKGTRSVATGAGKTVRWEWIGILKQEWAGRMLDDDGELVRKCQALYTLSTCALWKSSVTVQQPSTSLSKWFLAYNGVSAIANEVRIIPYPFSTVLEYPGCSLTGLGRATHPSQLNILWTRSDIE